MQHAVEVADAAQVVDRVTLQGLYERIGLTCGREVGATSYDTTAARDVGYRVVSELLRSKWNVE